MSDNHSNDFLPPWAVAVIVIGLASVAFVIVFGVSMVRNYFTLNRKYFISIIIAVVQEAEDHAGHSQEW